MSIRNIKVDSIRNFSFIYKKKQCYTNCYEINVFNIDVLQPTMGVAGDSQQDQEQREQQEKNPS